MLTPRRATRFGFSWRAFVVLIAATAIETVAERACGQGCEARWLPGHEAVTNGDVHALVVLPNGDVVAGGDFTMIGGVPANRIARWNGSTWSPLGAGVNERITALAAAPDGVVVAAGYFAMAGGEPANRIARWNGSTWRPLGPGFDGDIYAVAILGNGDVVAGGNGLRSAGSPVGNIARWNGSAWRAMGGFTGNWVRQLVTSHDGGLIASVFGTGVLWWNGIEWIGLGNGGTSGVAAMALATNGDIAAVSGGDTPASSPVLWRWNGSTWTHSPWSLPFLPNALVALPSGDLVAGIGFAGAEFGQIRSLSGSNGMDWTLEINGPVYALAALPNGDLVAGGGFSRVDGQLSARFAHWGSPCSCPADLDADGDVANGGTRDGAITVDDLIYFLSAYQDAISAADLDDDGDASIGTPDGAVTIEDLLFFLARFEAGC